MEKTKLEKLTYIRLPKGFTSNLGSFRIDPEKEIPILPPEGKDKPSTEDYTVENLVAGMVTAIAYDEGGRNIPYYKEFVLAVEPGIVERLNTAAIAQERKGNYDFAEELFLAVYHLLPQAASCINLATLYSYRAVDEKKKGGEKEKAYVNSTRRTLVDGLSRFGEDDQILSELASFEAYMGNIDEAFDYVERYLKVAEESDKKEEMKKLRKELSFQIENQDAIQEAYDFICMDEGDKALPIIEKFVAANPKVWNGHFLKGWALRINKEYAKAKESLMECLKLGESNAEIFNELAICELEDGERELAKAYLETAADLDEENLNILTNLAYLYIQDEEFDEAREALEKARFLAGDDKFVRGLIEAYEKATGEKIGKLIHEEYVSNDNEDDDADYPAKIFENEFMAVQEMEAEEEHHCHHHEGGCCGHHHHEDGEGCCGHHHEDGEGCCGGHGEGGCCHH